MQFLKRVREKQNITLEQLAEGLMTASQLGKIEKGQRPANKNMRDCLLGRLGVSSDLYENLLDIDDHAVWEQQQDILRAVEGKEISRAWELVNAFEKHKSSKDKIRLQFCFVMKAEILKQQGAGIQEIGKRYEMAAKLTVPDIGRLCIEKKLLTIQEINIVLEYDYYHKNADFTERCQSLMNYVEGYAYDDFSKVKIYPKIAYYYLREVPLRQTEASSGKVTECLRICSRAVELLRDTGRAFYLLELLEIKNNILKCMAECTEGGGKPQKLEAELHETTELARLLGQLYEEYGIPAYMQDCTYLYQQRWVFYVGDVLRIRRKMCGLTQKELCQGVCSVKTLRRTEKKQKNMQKKVLGELLERLGLSREFQRARLITDDREVLRLREEVADCRNNRNTEKTRELLQQMKKRVSCDIAENRQYFIELEASLDWMEGKITKDEFVTREEEALRCTLNAKDLYRADEVYLTQMEMICIRKRMQEVESQEKRRCIDFLLHFFEQYDKRGILPDCISAYEFAMVRLIKELGDFGEHQFAMDLSRKVLKEDLAYKRVWGIDGYLYEVLWNENAQQVKNGEVAKKKMTEGLKQCLTFSHFCKRTFYENFFRMKLHQV